MGIIRERKAFLSLILPFCVYVSVCVYVCVTLCLSVCLYLKVVLNS